MKFLAFLTLFLVLLVYNVDTAVTPQIRNYRNPKFIFSSREDKAETFVDLVKLAGYNVEDHEVTTDDGYMLNVHRITGSVGSANKPKKPPIILIHGLFAASDIWVLRGPKSDLAYLLSDSGYDVWCLNVRGNYYGKRHKKLSVKDQRFWRFSWHEFGIYDLPATINHVLSVTGMDKVSLVGHSMGSSIQMVLLSMKPEFNDKVNVVISFAPVAILTHKLPGLIHTIGIKYGKQLQKTFEFFGMHEFMPRSSTNVNLYTSICEENRIQEWCQQLVFFVLGLTSNDPFNTKFIPKLLKHFPQGTSVDTLIHYRQIAISGKFRMFDFGAETNRARYTSSKPPQYPLEKITVPVILYYGMNDAYTTENDVLALGRRLSNATMIKIEAENFSHLDFLFANNTKVLLYDNVISTLNKYWESVKIENNDI